VELAIGLISAVALALVALVRPSWIRGLLIAVVVGFAASFAWAWAALAESGWDCGINCGPDVDTSSTVAAILFFAVAGFLAFLAVRWTYRRFGGGAKQRGA
jgi:hypothetical protein